MTPRWMRGAEARASTAREAIALLRAENAALREENAHLLRERDDERDQLRAENVRRAQREHILNDRSLDEFDRGYQLARHDVETEVAALRAENAALRQQVREDRLSRDAHYKRAEEQRQRAEAAEKETAALREEHVRLNNWILTPRGT